MKQCTVCGSSNRVVLSTIGLLCGKHYIQYVRYNKTLDRTKYDSNEIIIVEETSYILLYDNKGNEVGRAIIDTEDLDKISNQKWCLDKNDYVKNSSQKYLHRILLGETNLYVDHINGNTLDNRKQNLRLCTNADNLKNRVKLPSNNTSGVIGVRFRKDRNKWYSEIKVNEETIRLGSYVNKEDAIKARKDAEEKYFKEFKPQINEIS